MNFLLDTHTLIWVLEGGDALSPESRKAIVEGKNSVFVSAASVWEISIKQAIGKLLVPNNLEDEIKRLRFEQLSISFKHADLAGKLPLIHKDPFDRMLVAQAQFEKLTLVTKDKIIPQYDVSTLKA